MGLSPHFPLSVCHSPLHLHSHVYRAITGCNAQVRSWPPTSCRAEVDSGHIFLCLVFSAFYLAGLSCGALTMSQRRASHTNRRHSCVFSTCVRQASNWTRENICSKSQSFVSVIFLCTPFRQNTLQFISEFYFIVGRLYF